MEWKYHTDRLLILTEQYSNYSSHPQFITRVNGTLCTLALIMANMQTNSFIHDTGLNEENSLTHLLNSISSDVLIELSKYFDDLGFKNILQNRGVSRIWEGGGPRIFFFRFGNLHVAKRHAAHGEAMRIVRRVRGHAPPRKFFKTVQFGAF